MNDNQILEVSHKLPGDGLTLLQELILACMYKYGAFPEKNWCRSNKAIMNAFENLYFEYPDIRAYIYSVAEMIHCKPQYIEGQGNWGRVYEDEKGRLFFIEQPAQLEYTELKLSKDGVEYLNNKRMDKLNQIMRSFRL